ncbi:MAG: terminase small subunit [Endomicrobiaceae bacterium]|nr:terminase small subunit [Endomicrobiaceae bacterium]
MTQTKKVKTKTNITQDKRFENLLFDDSAFIGQRKEVNGIIQIVRVGRPTKYTQDMCVKLINYFDVKPYTKSTKVDAQDNVIEYDCPNDMPTVVGFCLSVGINRDTFYEWVKTSKEFSDTFEMCKELQKEFLCTNALRNNFNSQFAKFWAINNTDMRDAVFGDEDDINGVVIKTINFSKKKKNAK